MLAEIIKKEYIKVKYNASDWIEAITVAGELLLEDNLITEKYIEAMINTVKEKGPYIVIAPGIAIAHARPEDGVNKIGMSLVTLKEPVKFGNKNNDPVEVLFAFGTIDSKSHIEAFRSLTELLMRDKFIEDMRNMENSDQVFEYIKSV